MTQPLSAEQTNDVTSHHKAGHLCILVKAGIPFSHFQRLPNGNSHLFPNDDYQAEELNELYAVYLTIRASRFSQKLSPYHTPDIEAESFGTADAPGDDQDLEGRSQDLFARFQVQWSGEEIDPATFHSRLLAVTDDVLGQAYQDPAYVRYVQGVAAALMASGTLSKPELDQMVEEQWNLSGASIQLFDSERFAAVCTGMTA